MLQFFLSLWVTLMIRSKVSESVWAEQKSDQCKAASVDDYRHRNMIIYLASMYVYYSTSCQTTVLFYSVTNAIYTLRIRNIPISGVHMESGGTGTMVVSAVGASPVEWWVGRAADKHTWLEAAAGVGRLDTGAEHQLTEEGRTAVAAHGIADQLDWAPVAFDLAYRNKSRAVWEVNITSSKFIKYNTGIASQWRWQN